MSKNDENVSEPNAVNYDEHGNAKPIAEQGDLEEAPEVTSEETTEGISESTTENTADVDEPAAKPEHKTRKKKSASNVKVTEGTEDSKKSKGQKKIVLHRKGKSQMGKLIEAVQDKHTGTSNNGRIIPVDGTLEAESEEKKKNAVLIELASSMKNRRVLKAMLDGVECKENGIPHAILHYKKMIRVVIPYKEFLRPSDYEKEEDPDKAALLLLNKRLGSEVDFIVCGSDGETVVASRIAAMAKERYEYYLHEDRNGKYIINKGNDVEARVVVVNRKSVVVEIHGVETFIKPEELAWEHIFDCAEKFEVGQKIIVHVLDLDKEDTENIKISVSARLTSTNIQKTAINECEVNGSYVGIVSGISPNSTIFVKLQNGGIALCKPADHCPIPTRNARVTVRVKIIDKDYNRIIGLVTHVSSMRR